MTDNGVLVPVASEILRKKTTKRLQFGCLVLPTLTVIRGTFLQSLHFRLF